MVTTKTWNIIILSVAWQIESMKLWCKLWWISTYVHMLFYSSQEKNNSLTELYQKSYLDLQNIPTNSAIYLLSKAFPRKYKNLSRIVEHYYGLDRRVCQPRISKPIFMRSNRRHHYSHGCVPVSVHLQHNKNRESLFLNSDY
jgi:hypothetical protein